MILMFSILEICAFISYIYFKTIVIDNLHLFRKWRGSSPYFLCLSLFKLHLPFIFINREDIYLWLNVYPQETWLQARNFLKHWLNVTSGFFHICCGYTFPADPKILSKQLPTKVLHGNLNPWRNPQENREFLVVNEAGPGTEHISTSPARHRFWI